MTTASLVIFRMAGPGMQVSSIRAARLSHRRGPCTYYDLTCIRFRLLCTPRTLSQVVSTAVALLVSVSSDAFRKRDQVSTSTVIADRRIG